MEIELKVLPFFLPSLLLNYLLTHLLYSSSHWNHFKCHKFLSSSSLCYTTWYKLEIYYLLCYLGKSLLQSKIKVLLPKVERLCVIRLTHMIVVLNIHSKSLRYPSVELTEAWRSPISYESLVQLIVETDADLYQHLWWSDFYLLLLVLHLFQENFFCNTLWWLFWNVKMIFLTTII